jgi:hypothetical protein
VYRLWPSAIYSSDWLFVTLKWVPIASFQLPQIAFRWLQAKIRANLRTPGYSYKTRLPTKQEIEAEI